MPGFSTLFHHLKAITYTEDRIHIPQIQDWPPHVKLESRSELLQSLYSINSGVHHVRVISSIRAPKHRRPLSLPTASPIREEMARKEYTEPIQKG